MIKVFKQFQSAPTVIPTTHYVMFSDTTDPNEKMQIRGFMTWADAQDWILYETDYKIWKETA